MRILQLLAISFLLTSNVVLGEVLVNGDFEVNSIQNGWITQGQVVLTNKGLKEGSTQSVQINATAGKISQTFQQLGSEWSFEFYFASQSPELFDGSNRAFNINLNGAQLNLRIGAGGAIQLYNGNWKTIGNGNEISFSVDKNSDGDLIDSDDILNVHRLKIVGHNYGTINPTIAIYVSAVNSDELNLIAENLSIFQSTPTFLKKVEFLTNYGFVANQSFMVDECKLTENGTMILSETNGSTIVHEKNETSDTILVSLSNAPISDVRIDFSEVGENSHLTIEPTSLNFTSENFSIAQAIVIKAKDDEVSQDGRYYQTIRVTANTNDTLFQHNNYPDIIVTIFDDESEFIYPNYSGIYPHLAVTNSDGECGIGAIVPWQNNLWYATYSAHYPNGSDDKLYQLDTTLNVTIRPESVGGTPANRMIHKESDQLIIASYLIDNKKNVRVIPPSIMPGRMTANARHLTDPENRVYFITMEEGIYDVDVHTLDITTLHEDGNSSGVTSIVPGQHGKGGYVGQNHLMISNNGIGGVLAEWKGFGDGNPDNPSSWTLVDKNKHTEITTKGGIYGASSQDDPVWSLGWDNKSVLLNVCDNGGKWIRYRLPKGSYTHDADHGWYTEWPRIRDVGEGNGKLLMNMHGLMYNFPSEFSHSNTGGIVPFSTFLKMIVDYTSWNNKLVFACNDATKFSNGICPRDQSNLLFTTIEELPDYGGAASGFGGVWVNDSLKAGIPSEAMLIAGFENRIIHFTQNSGTSVQFTIQGDKSGNSTWSNIATVTIPTSGYGYYVIPSSENTQWIRIIPEKDIQSASAYLYFSNEYRSSNDDLVKSIPLYTTSQNINLGVIRPMESSDMKLQYAADIVSPSGEITKSYYEIGEDMRMVPVDNSNAESLLRTTYKPSKEFEIDHASVIYTSNGKKYRLPVSDNNFSTPTISGYPRGKREVVTERSLINLCGTIYEFPRDDAGGFKKIRPITTHNKLIYDFCSWRGMLVLSGNFNEPANDKHYKKSIDDKVGLWFGNVDDLFKMGMPRGFASTWKDDQVVKNVPSLPLLMQGYNNKKVTLSHNHAEPVTFNLEVDFLADGNFVQAFSVVVPPNETLTFEFPEGFQAHWVRTSTDTDCIATATFHYNSDNTTQAVASLTRINKILAYPNPVHRVLNINGLTQNTQVEIINISGAKKVSTETRGKIDVSSLTPGMYFLKINDLSPIKFIKR